MAHEESLASKCRSLGDIAAEGHFDALGGKWPPELPLLGSGKVSETEVQLIIKNLAAGRKQQRLRFEDVGDGDDDHWQWL